MTGLEIRGSILRANLQSATPRAFDSPEFASGLIESESILRQIKAREAASVVWHGWMS